MLISKFRILLVQLLHCLQVKLNLMIVHFIICKLPGVKARYNSIGLDVKSEVHSFDKDIYESSKLDSIMVWAQAAGKHTGALKSKYFYLYFQNLNF